MEDLHSKIHPSGVKKNKTDSWLEFAGLLRNLNNKLMWKAHMSLITVKITM